MATGAEEEAEAGVAVGAEVEAEVVLVLADCGAWVDPPDCFLFFDGFPPMAVLLSPDSDPPWAGLVLLLAAAVVAGFLVGLAFFLGSSSSSS